MVGLGPFAGVLAIASADIGALGKLFSEAIENVDRKPAEGVTASGGNSLQRIRFGILPEALPVLASQILYFIESNTRSATIIGIVGAGGIGQYLKESIDQFEWEKVSFLIILVLIAVAIIDFISSRLRSAMMIGEAAGPPIDPDCRREAPQRRRGALARIVEADHPSLAIISEHFRVTRPVDDGVQRRFGVIGSHLIFELVPEADQRRAMARPFVENMLDVRHERHIASRDAVRIAPYVRRCQHPRNAVRRR